MNVIELDRALRKLRLSGMADVLEARLLQAQADKMIPLDLLSVLVADELLRRQDRLLARRIKQADFRDVGKTLDTFDFDFNKKMNRKLVFELATTRFVTQHEDVLFLGKQSRVPELLAISDVMLLPSEYEAFGLAALEAMACGVPTVAARTGGIPELITDGGIADRELVSLPVGEILHQALIKPLVDVVGADRGIVCALHAQPSLTARVGRRAGASPASAASTP